MSDERRCPFCHRPAGSTPCGPAYAPDERDPLWTCWEQVSSCFDLARRWAVRTNRDERALSMGAVQVNERWSPPWPFPSADDDRELRDWIARTVGQYWCVGLRWGHELCEGAR